MLLLVYYLFMLNRQKRYGIVFLDMGFLSKNTEKHLLGNE